MQNGVIHLIKTALSDFKRNKVRTFLTSLGIMIGVLSVVMLIALGLGLKNYIKESFEGLGVNLIMVMPGSGFGGETGFTPGGVFGGAEFDEKDVSNIRRIDNVKYVAPSTFDTGVIEAGSEEEIGYIMGVNTDIFGLMSVDIIEGELFSESDNKARSKVAVLGYVLAENLFGTPEESVGRTVRFSDQRFKVIGAIDKTGDDGMDKSVIIPYKTTFGSMNPDKTFWGVWIGVESEEDVEQVKSDIETTLLKRYDEDDFSVTEESEILQTVNQIFNILNGVLVAIGSISLLVGGIGIMNIMYASVTERTKEVGIRRAVGATEEDILKQFLTESILLSLFGGLSGLGISLLIIIIVRPFFPIGINVLAVSLALGISTIIGVFFGVFPARRAAKLPPIEAIRYE